MDKPISPWWALALVVAIVAVTWHPQRSTHPVAAAPSLSPKGNAAGETISAPKGPVGDGPLKVDLRGAPTSTPPITPPPVAVTLPPLPNKAPPTPAKPAGVSKSTDPSLPANAGPLLRQVKAIPQVKQARWNKDGSIVTVETTGDLLTAVGHVCQVMKQAKRVVKVEAVGEKGQRLTLRQCW